MISYEYIKQVATPSGWSRSITHEKENTKQANANSTSQFIWYLLELLGLHLWI